MKCVLPQNGMRFAAKWVAFWPKMERVLAQNGSRFGPKQKAFWPKMENVYALNALRWYDFTCLKPWQIPYNLQEREQAKLEVFTTSDNYNALTLILRKHC